jgi:hypothetical protein
MEIIQMTSRVGATCVHRTFDVAVITVDDCSVVGARATVVLIGRFLPLPISTAASIVTPADNRRAKLMSRDIEH